VTPAGSLDWHELTEARWDAVVIGAGPAGALAARELAAAGARVLLVEKKSFPRDKVCGGCLNGRALAVLESVVEQAGGVALNELALGFQGKLTRLALPTGAALARSRLDAALVAAAMRSGACFVAEVQAGLGAIEGTTRLIRLESRGACRVIPAGVVLVAAGLGNHGLEAGCAAATRIAAGSWLGAGCVIAESPAVYGEGTIFMSVGRDGYVGLVRLRDGGLNVAAAFRPGLLRQFGCASAAAAILSEAGFPPLSALESARWLGTPPFTRRTRPLAVERVFLLGDAAGYVEPFTGEGIASALASARAVGPLALQAMARWSPSLEHDWHQLHRRVVGSRQGVSRAAAAALHRPWLARLAFQALARMPAAARPLLRYLNASPPS
jgi:menaquinone-9 beta-reductase